MNVLVAKTAGFCFGVNRAVCCAFEEAERREGTGRIYTLGPLIHNPSIVEALRKRGVGVIESPSDAERGDTVIIRAHGVSAGCCEELVRRGIRVVDATCPYVAKIHRIVRAASDAGKTVLIFGHRDHPEVLGIRGHCKRSFTFTTKEELVALTERENLINSPVVLVSQTTMNAGQWQKSCEYAKNLYTKIDISDTICKATDERQQEAAELSARCEAMIVIGGRSSSNTRRLFEVCQIRCKRVFLIESADELVLSDFSDCTTVGVTAGASTPEYIIQAVCEKFS